jgi:Spy/CpxP family protein refolding chaperone
VAITLIVATAAIVLALAFGIFASSAGAQGMQNGQGNGQGNSQGAEQGNGGQGQGQGHGPGGIPVPPGQADLHLEDGSG